MSALADRHRISRELRRLDPNRPAGRKTAAKVEHRRLPHEMPDWHLVLHLSTSLAFGIPLGPVKGVLGVVMLDGNRAEIVGKNKQYCCDRAASFIKTIAKGRPGERIQASMTRQETNGSAPSAPGRAPERIAGEILFLTGNPAVVIDGFAMRPMFHETR